jgi:hypothetical protein
MKDSTSPVLAPADDDGDIFDRGLSFDLETLLARRQMIKLLGLGGLSAGLAAVVGCAPGVTGSTSPGATSSSSTGSSAVASCDTIPEETAGPFPGDGSNGPDVLNQSGVVRSDIRSSFGTSTTTAEGVPLTIKLAIQDQDNGCKPLPGAAVYLWHCDREGRYSLYSEGVTNENYLRGLQEAGGAMAS